VPRWILMYKVLKGVMNPRDFCLSLTVPGTAYIIGISQIVWFSTLIIVELASSNFSADP
jgi:hypothetical protein